MIEIEEIRNLASDFLQIEYNENTKVLTIDSLLNPKILDENFSELEERIINLENRIKIKDERKN